MPHTVLTQHPADVHWELHSGLEERRWSLKQLSVFWWHLLAVISTSIPLSGTTSLNHTQIFNKMSAGHIPGLLHSPCVSGKPLWTL